MSRQMATEPWVLQITLTADQHARLQSGECVAVDHDLARVEFVPAGRAAYWPVVRPKRSDVDLKVEVYGAVPHQAAGVAWFFWRQYTLEGRDFPTLNDALAAAKAGEDRGQAYTECIVDSDRRVYRRDELEQLWASLEAGSVGKE